MERHKNKPDWAFTLIEVVIAVALSALVIGAVQVLFAKYVGISIKGEDTITSTRSAMLLLEDIRKEMMMASGVASPTVVISRIGDALDLSKPSTDLRINTSQGTVNYSILKDAQGRKYLEKSLVAAGRPLFKKVMEVNRLQEFSVYWFEQKNVSGTAKFNVKSLFVSIELQGNLPGQNATKIELNSVITPPLNVIENSNWPY